MEPKNFLSLSRPSLLLDLESDLLGELTADLSADMLGLPEDDWCLGDDVVCFGLEVRLFFGLLVE